LLTVGDTYQDPDWYQPFEVSLLPDPNVRQSRRAAKPKPIIAPKISPLRLALNG